MLKKTIKGFVQRLFAAPRAQAAPQRFSPETHGIDPRQVSRHAVKVCQVLQEHGYQAYIVGGAVRDLIAGLTPTDFDVATNATPEQIRPLFRRARIIGRRFQLVHVVFGREVIETSTFRAAAEDDEFTDVHGRLLRDNLFGNHQDDAARRDFTLNALYYDPITQEVIDFHNGVHDLQNRVVRIIGEAETRYREDPIRMLRAIRFAAKLDAKIEANTLEPIQQLSSLVSNVPSARRFDELLKLLTCGHAMQCLRALQEQGLHLSVLPLLDDAMALDGGEEFIEWSLERTDMRVRTGKTVSPSFLFAALLWPLVRHSWRALRELGEHSMPALLQAADEVITRHGRRMPIQKRFQGDMREIWFMQPRFAGVSPRAIRRMLGQARFRAAVDFLQLRAQAREVDSVEAQWWADLADANDNVRTEMLEARYPARAQAGTRKKRRRPRRRRPESTTDPVSSAASATPPSTPDS